MLWQFKIVIFHMGITFALSITSLKTFKIFIYVSQLCFSLTYIGAKIYEEIFFFVLGPSAFREEDAPQDFNKKVAQT